MSNLRLEEKEYIVIEKGTKSSLKYLDGESFFAEEFDCNCGDSHCSYTFIDLRLLELLQKVRDWAGSAIHINSAYRCPRHNRGVGGAKNSLHLTGKAADIRCKSKTPKEIHDYIDKDLNHQGGLGLYNSFVHVDVRDCKARWVK